MAQIKEMTIQRKFNLGNYQTLDIGLVATIEPGDDIDEVAKAMDKKILNIKKTKINLEA